MGRVERRGEAGFIVYCKCESFLHHSPAVLATETWRRGTCRSCGGFSREWRCPRHFLKAVPLEKGGKRLGAGCPTCGAAPLEQTHDPYMTKKALHG